MLKLLPKAFKAANNYYSLCSSFLPSGASPFVFKIRITQKCNMSCPYCFLKESLNRKEQGHLQPEEWRKIFDTLPFWTNLDITGAEPFAAAGFLDFLKVCAEYPFKKSVTTNGFNVSSEKLQAIFENKVHYLMVSLDGLEAAHDASRNKPGSFASAVSFLDNVFAQKKKRKSKYPVVNVKFTLHDKNHGDLPKLGSYLKQRYGSDLILTVNLLYQNSSLSLEKNYTSFKALEVEAGNTASYTNADKVLFSVKTLLKEKNVSVSFSPPLKRKRDLKAYLDNPGSCGVGSCHLYRNNLTMYYNGDLMPCSFGLKLGNIREFDYKLNQVRKGEAFKDFMDSFNRPSKACQGCCSGKHGRL